MKRLILLLLLFIGSTQAYSQKDTPSPAKQVYTPEGVLDNIYDLYGNKYSLDDIKIKHDPNAQSREMAESVLLCQSGIFNLYFEQGCGMDNTSSATENARREVLCQVFHDLSDFINSPLNGTPKVNIWVRKISSIPNVPAGALALATSFYNLPPYEGNNAPVHLGGIIDSEVWKTIHAGVDSYTNVIYPISTDASSQNGSGLFYHGQVAFNFTSFTWYTELQGNTPGSAYDLYSVVLHEVMHALGFATLIGANGGSRLGFGNNYFSRYDRHLQTGGADPLLINTGACSPMYNYFFNNQINTNVLYPNCNEPTHIYNGVWDDTVCETAIRFVTANVDVPVFTPFCYINGSSLSHFEDECYQSYQDNEYFTMSNANNQNSIKRFIQPEERNALCDIGYSVKTTYGNSGHHSYKDYGPDSTCPGINVAGINDGIDLSGSYQFIFDSGTSLVINGAQILGNDYTDNLANLEFECLQDIYDQTATFSTITGNASDAITYHSDVPGLHLLRYVPRNVATDHRGNITYVYVYVKNNCTITDACNLVKNGDFEQHFSAPNSAGQMFKVCGWKDASYRGSADYFASDATNANNDVPCNSDGFEPDSVAGHGAYVGMYMQKARYELPKQVYVEPIKTELTSPLLPNTQYELTFQVSLAEKMAGMNTPLQAYFSVNELPLYLSGVIPDELLDASMLFTSTPISILNGWQTITFTFTTGDTAGQRYLYLGGLRDVPFTVAPVAATLTPGCPYTLNPDSNTAYYFLDNVRLVLTQQPVFTFNLPETICVDEILPDLSVYLSPQLSGDYTGPGVSGATGTFSFNADVAGEGTHSILYTYAAGSSCEQVLKEEIKVVKDEKPIFEQIPPICFGTKDVELPTQSVNNLHGTWEPSVVNNQQTTTYTFIPDNILCVSPTTMTIVVLQPDDPACYSCPNTLQLFTTEPNSFYLYQRHNWITTQESYTISGSKEIIMRAGDYVMLLPNTTISTDKHYMAYIYDCCIDCQRDRVSEVKKLTLYPNPSSGHVDLRMENQRFGKVIVATLEGRTIFESNMKSTNLFSFDVGSFSDGIYMIVVIADDGEVFTEKLIKN